MDPQARLFLEPLDVVPLAAPVNLPVEVPRIVAVGAEFAYVMPHPLRTVLTSAREMPWAVSAMLPAALSWAPAPTMMLAWASETTATALSDEMFAGSFKLTAATRFWLTSTSAPKR